jgi:UDP-2-acetamido-3-amino-2,3-dideoxy-glucuronate N-acetyltransferase
MRIGSRMILGSAPWPGATAFTLAYDCDIGEDVKAGAFVTIQQDCKIGDRCTIMDGAFIAAGTILEDEVFIGPGAVICNCAEPRATNPDGTRKGKDDWKREPVTIRRRASIGANATILPGVAIGEEAVVAAGAVVVQDVPQLEMVAGNPSRFVRTILPSFGLP